MSGLVVGQLWRFLQDVQASFPEFHTERSQDGCATGLLRPVRQRLLPEFPARNYLPSSTLSCAIRVRLPVDDAHGFQCFALRGDHQAGLIFPVKKVA